MNEESTPLEKGGQRRNDPELSILGRIGGRKFGAVLLGFAALILALILTAVILPDNAFAWEAVKGLTTAFTVIALGFYGGNVAEKKFTSLQAATQDVARKSSS